MLELVGNAATVVNLLVHHFVVGRACACYGLAWIGRACCSNDSCILHLDKIVLDCEEMASTLGGCFVLLWQLLLSFHTEGALYSNFSRAKS